MWSENPELEEAARLVIRAWARRDERLPELAAFAIRGQGFCSDATGLTYPGDLDDYDRAQGQYVPPGYIEAYLHYGPPEGQSWLVPEPLYLAVLAEMLDAAGFAADAARVRARSLVGE
jgi:hypothetical protein